MSSERAKRRVLYGSAALSWVLSAAVAAHAALTESVVTRLAVMFTLSIAIAATTAVLFVVFVAPLEKVYRHGYEAGLRADAATECVAEVVRTGTGGTVIPFRPVRSVTHQDN